MVTEPGTPDNPLTVDGERAGKWCRCHGCRGVSLCTPRSDFYTGRVGGPLFCSGCMYAGAAVREADAHAREVLS